MMDPAPMLEDQGKGGSHPDDYGMTSANPKSAYTMPGILHFIQHEWGRFEMERAQWELEKAEMQAKIAFLQGERKGQENLKNDLIRRIKMLEFALKQERAKVHKLKYGTDLPMENKVFENEDGEELKAKEDLPSNPNMSWRQGRQLLRQYLQEVGYTDTILDVRSQRVRALLGNFESSLKKPENDKNHLVNGISPDEGNSPKSISELRASMGGKELSESDVMSDFAFLASAPAEEDDEFINDIIEDDLDGGIGDKQRVSRAQPNDATDENADDQEDENPDTETVMSEFDFLSAGNYEINPKTLGWQVDQKKLNEKKEQFKMEKKHSKKKGMNRPDKKQLQNMFDTLRGNVGDESDSLPFTVGGTRNSIGDDTIENALGLGELAELTVANEADPLSFEITSTKDTLRKTWTQKYTLRSHFDSIRAVEFIPNEAGLITASEDKTLKLWNLNKTVSSKKSQALDVEPIYSFRGHTSAVLSLAIDSNGEICYSGGLDASIRSWKIPSLDLDTFDKYVPFFTGKSLVGHTDAVWNLSYSDSRRLLLSASSDSTVRLWDPASNDPLLRTFTSIENSIPTFCKFVPCDPSQAVVSHTDGRIVLYDLETGQIPTTLADGDDVKVNCVACHPTMPITISAHDDRHIKFYDNNAGKLIHSMVAHLDSVTSLAVDPNGLYLLSGSHDCSIRLWNLDSKTCVQELTSHRKKFDESIHAVAFHPSASYIASAGADAFAKVFV